MNGINRITQAIDDFQRRHSPLAFIYAVIKKYGDDQAGYQTALVTYYGFLSLFPLLLVLTTVAGIAGEHNPALGHKLVQSVSSYFPVVGQQLDSSVHGLNRSGPALLIGLLFTFYGARGIVDAYRHALNHLWHIPYKRRSNFPRSLVRSLTLIIGGGTGFLLASVITGWASTAGHGVAFRLLSIILNLGILYVVFIFITKASLPLQISRSKFRVGAAISATGLTILQQIGGYIVAHESKNLANSYSALFATTLGLLAWIYLQTQVALYAVEVDTVRAARLWPRSLTGKNETDADKLVQKGRDLSNRLIDDN